MKTIFLILVCLGVALSGFGQTGAALLVSVQNATTSDTLVDATTDIQAKPVSGAWKKVVLQTNLTKLSGTGAGTISVEVSLDGTNYKAHPVASSATVANSASQVFVWELDNFAYTHVRLKYVGSGTQSMKWASKVKWAGAL